MSRFYRFRGLEKLGGGSYGAVYRAQDTILNKEVAVKIIPVDTKMKAVSVRREIACSQKLPNHPNISSILVNGETYTQDGVKAVALAFDLMDRDLDAYINSVASVPADLIQHFMHELLQAVKYCHYQRIMHRDLKPANILLDKLMNLKVTDFGLADAIIDVDQGSSTNVVSLYYRSPELLLGWTKYGGQIDMWSVGCIFAKLITGRTLFRGSNEHDQLSKIFAVVGTPTQETWPWINELPVSISKFPIYPSRNLSTDIDQIGPVAVDLLIKLLTANPKDRITAAEALEHPYFSGYNWTGPGVVL